MFFYNNKKTPTKGEIFWKRYFTEARGISFERDFFPDFSRKFSHFRIIFGKAKCKNTKTSGNNFVRSLISRYREVWGHMGSCLRSKGNLGQSKSKFFSKKIFFLKKVSNFLFSKIFGQQVYHWKGNFARIIKNMFLWGIGMGRGGKIFDFQKNVFCRFFIYKKTCFLFFFKKNANPGWPPLTP